MMLPSKRLSTSIYHDLPIEGWEGRNLFKPLDILEKPQVAISRSFSSSCNSCQHQLSGRSSYGLNSSIIVDGRNRSPRNMWNPHDDCRPKLADIHEGLATFTSNLTRHHECNLEDNIMQSERNPENQKEVLGTKKTSDTEAKNKWFVRQCFN